VKKNTEFCFPSNILKIKLLRQYVQHQIYRPSHLRFADPGCLFRIMDPNFWHPGYLIFIFSIPDFRIRIKEFKYFNTKKWFLSSRKYDPDCPSWIPDPGVKKAPDPGSGSATLLQIISYSIFQASQVNIFLVVGVLTRQHTLYMYKTP
jgi:hypothetical protein